MDGNIFDFIDHPQAKRDAQRPLIVDSFAGGGGASTGIEMALGRSPDVAINHDPVALAMHEANHPDTLHLTSSVYAIDPADLVQPGQEVGLAWFSPDCKHHSKAKGGKPLDRNIRDLAWVVVHWAERVKPRVIILENVEEFQDWCPLDAQGRPDKTQKGATFKKWVSALRRLGYVVEWRELRACDYGAPTIRKRLFLVARCDGRPIVWPAPTHTPPDKLLRDGYGHPNDPDCNPVALKPHRSAAEIIDWSLPCPSIFDTSAEIMEKHGLRASRPLAENTLRRIARGVQRFVIDAREPFFVTYGQHGGHSRSALDPMHTLCASVKDQNAVVIPSLVQVGYGEAPAQKPRSLDIHKPLGTVVAGGGKHALVAAFLAQHNGGPNMEGNAGRSARAPLSTITTTGSQQSIIAAHMVNMHGTSRSARDMGAPVTTITAGGGKGRAPANPCIR